MRFKSSLLFSLTFVFVCACCWPPANLASAGDEPVPQSFEKASAGADILARYLSIPKGVVLEGTAVGFDPLVSVTYDKKANEFIINGERKYKNPISRKEFHRVLEALRKDDRMGVTLIEGEARVYGPLNADSDMVKQMVATDMLLGGVVFGIERLEQGVRLPGGYKPQRAPNRQIPVVACARFLDYVFGKSGDRYIRSSCVLDVRLIPLSARKTARGGHLPDLAKTAEYVMEPTDGNNVRHIKTHQSEYLKIPFVAKTAAIEIGRAHV